MDKNTAEGWQMLSVKLLENHYNKFQKGVVAVILFIFIFFLFLCLFYSFSFFPNSFNWESACMQTVSFERVHILPLNEVGVKLEVESRCK